MNEFAKPSQPCNLGSTIALAGCAFCIAHMLLIQFGMPDITQINASPSDGNWLENGFNILHIILFCVAVFLPALVGSFWCAIGFRLTIVRNDSLLPFHIACLACCIMGLLIHWGWMCFRLPQ